MVLFGRCDSPQFLLMSVSFSELLLRVQRSRLRLHVLLLAALAYIPSLAAAPGKIPADTKLFLYLNPARLTGDAAYSWDTRQFAGWVPHQTLSYLWPSGPWYSLCNAVGMPDWIAHRLWIGSLMFAAGLGARWAAKHLGIPATGALIAAMFYQLSPYVLPYVSRTSAMLLPWAGLGWLIGLTIRAATRTKWRDVALFGLVMATVAAPNATAILMVAPGPVLWLLHAAWGRSITWRRAIVVAAKIGAISLLMSAWWIAMLSVQGRYGADVLGYSETLEAVSSVSSASEVLRGMGYWLFYLRDPVGFATTASEHYMASGQLVAISFMVLGVALLGLVATRWTSRRYAALLVFVGVVLAVGVHPIANSSPLMAPLAQNSRSALALALRSSTRALPLSTFGLALGAGALVVAISRTSWRVRHFAPWLIGLLAIVNLPALFDGGFVDPNLVHDQHVPTAWTQAATALDAAPKGYRVLQLPGIEFGAFRWGYTVDPPLPALTNRPVITRDLLPLGSAAAMDTLYALDDRFQEGTINPSAVAPIARLFGADTLWLTNDLAFERFRSPRPEITNELFAQSSTQLGTARPYGVAAVSTPTLAMIDEQSISNEAVGTPLAPVDLVPVLNPQPIVRAKIGNVVLAGSGDGIVDAAGAGLLTGDELIRYAANLPAADPSSSTPDPIASADRVIVTDSNRKRAHHWRGSQDVTGFTEDGSTDPGVLTFDSADQRIPVFADQTSSDMTIAEQRGAIHASASSYGEPFAYRPEDRAAMAIDGEANTAWITGDHGQPIGEFLRLTADAPIDKVTLTQPLDHRNRWITRVTITDDSGSRSLDLTAESRSATGQLVALQRRSSHVTIRIDAIDYDRTARAPALDGVGFAEIVTDMGIMREVVRVPGNVLLRTSGTQPVDLVFSRLRTRPTNRYRRDPELTMNRAFTLSDPREFSVSISARVSQRSSDAVLAELLQWNGTTSSAHLTGVPAMGGWAATDGDPATSWVSPFGAAVGASLRIPLDSQNAITSLSLRQPASAQLGTITEVTIAAGSTTNTVPVPAPDAQGISALTFPALSGDAINLTITATNGASTTDRRFADRVTLPVGISEISGIGIAAASLPEQFDSGCRGDLVTIDGVQVPLRLSGDLDALLSDHDAHVDLCGSPQITIGGGEHIIATLNGLHSGADINQIVLRSSSITSVAPTAAPDPSTTPAAPSKTPTVALLSSTRTTRTVSVGACPTGCWFVFGEGYNTGWTASIAGTSLGTQQVVDGGFNGWFLPPNSAAQTVNLVWAGQNSVNLGLLLSGLGIALCLALIVFDRRRTTPPDVFEPRFTALWSHNSTEPLLGLIRPSIVTISIATVAGVLVIAPKWGLLCGFIAFACCVPLRRPRLVGPAAFAVAMYIAAVMVHRVRTYHPFPNGGWPGVFEDMNRPALVVIVLLLASISTRRSSLDDDSR